jgi:hypothetical protein
MPWNSLSLPCLDVVESESGREFGNAREGCIAKSKSEPLIRQDMERAMVRLQIFVSTLVPLMFGTSSGGADYAVPTPFVVRDLHPNVRSATAS